MDEDSCFGQCRCAKRFIHTHGLSPSLLAWNNGQDHHRVYRGCKRRIVWPCNITFSRSWIEHSPPLFGLIQWIHAPKNGISLGGWWVREFH
jgi:hypothetical protein